MILLAVALTAIPEEVTAAVEATRSAPLAERIDRISASLLGRDYALDPAGEGEGPDGDPVARYDVFDCVTFVEEVLALALGGLTGADAVRRDLRYGPGTPPTYANRNHLMELQWLPDAVSTGRLVDVTARIGPTKTIVHPVDVNTWNSWPARSGFGLTDAQLPVGTSRVAVVDLSTALANIDKFPVGALVLPVRAPREHRPVLTFHVGFVVPGPSGPLIRHATKLGDGRVRSDSLAWYLNNAKTYPWPVEGVAVFLPTP